MSNPNDLIEKYHRLGEEITDKYEEIEALSKQQREVKKNLPHLYYVQGYGDGLAERVHFVGTHDECKVWVGHNPKFTLDERGEQIYVQKIPKIGTFILAGVIRGVTPVDERWWEISNMADDLKREKGGK